MGKGQIRSLILIVAIAVVAASRFSVSGAERADIRVHIDLRIEFQDVRSGSLSLLIIDGTGWNRSFTQEDWPRADLIANPNMRMVMDNLSRSSDEGLDLFGSVLDCGGGEVISNETVAFSRDGQRIGMMYTARFELSGGGRRADFRYLRFLEGVSLPKVDRDDLESLARYERAQDEMRKVSLAIEIAPPADANLDFQWDGTYHSRSPDGEHLAFTSDLLEFMDHGHRFAMIGYPFLSPGMMIWVASATSLAGAILLGLAWWRRRFERWGLIFPGIGCFLVIVPLWMYIRPYLNPYGTFDGGIGSMAVIILVYTSGMHFMPSGKKGRELPVAEAEQEVQREYEMPRVIYVDRPVIIRERPRRDPVEEMDPYAVLGLPRTASDDEVERAYREQVLRYHPDRYGESPEWVREAAMIETRRRNDAYERIRSGKGPPLSS